MRRALLLAFLLITPNFYAVAFGDIKFDISNPSPAQGDTVIVSFPEKKLSPESAFFDNQPVSFFTYKGFPRAAFGIPANKRPGNYWLEINFGDRGAIKQVIRVKPKKFPRVAVAIPPKLGLTPKALVENLKNTKITLENIVGLRTPGVFFNQPFGLPLTDNRNIGSPFGEIRKTGSEEIRHLGIDLIAPIGTPVGAINDGVVRKAYFDSVYGNSVILDHGEGIFSLYLHLNEIKVKQGDSARKGDVIGTVGETGYSLAPHLHLSIKINNISVDPLRFVNLLK